MCGILGIIEKNSTAAKRNDRLALSAAMLEILTPRGPDGQGVFQQGDTILGHRRLKIFDLSDKAQQPMVDSFLGLTIVYNGALYNYRELRQELEAKGYTFFSTGDTEVLLKAYHAYGKEAVKKFNGMFAFALWHRDDGKVVLVRDRLGIKPLYYADLPDHFAFASSLPALLADKDIAREIDPVALHHYMSFHAVVPPPRTIIKQIRKLEPGTMMTIEPDKEVKIERYWDLQFVASTKEHYGLEDWKSLLRHKLAQAIARRQIADVPVGVLLSGGLDSSLVVGLLADAGQRDLNTFSIGFESVNNEKGNEFEYSDIIARHYGTVHHKIEVDSRRLLPSLPGCVRAMSEPMVSHDCIGFYLLSQEVAKHVTVVQSGQGADEVFAGYHWYPPMMHCADPLSKYREVFFDGDHDDFCRIVHPRFHGEDHSAEFVRSFFAESAEATGIENALRIDTKIMLIDDPVKRVDNMTMAWGLEARVPFLDHELVEFAARIPPELKVQGGGKYILKLLGREIIPSEVIDRPKGYFPVPVLKYFRGEYLEFVQEVMTRQSSKERGLFQDEYVQRVLDKPDAYITPLRGSRLWQMALLNYWLDVHNI